MRSSNLVDLFLLRYCAILKDGVSLCHSNRPSIQQEIRDAAIKGAYEKGFNLILGYDNQPKAGTQETYENWGECLEAALQNVLETVNLD